MGHPKFVLSVATPTRPPRISGSAVPVAVMPSMSSFSDPIIQSTWMRLSLAPLAASCWGVSLSPSRRHDV